jgi:hypothetical protein
MYAAGYVPVNMNVLEHGRIIENLTEMEYAVENLAHRERQQISELVLLLNFFSLVMRVHLP